MDKQYFFQSKRLGFRNWLPEDLPPFAEMNADEEVMEHFPKPLSRQETVDSIERLQKHYAVHGHTYYAVDILETGEFIGFIGLAYQDYETAFNPSIDMGWRLRKVAWGKGYATEGAKRCLAHAFTDLQFNRLIAVCTVQNQKSENVMQKIGMIKQGEFKHPNLTAFPDYETCLWYEIRKG